MQLLDTILYWQRVKNNCRLGTGSVFNYCSYLGAPVEDVNICPVANYKLFLVKSGGATKCKLYFYGCFNFLNIYATTKCKLDFMLDASTNSIYTTTKCK